MEIKNKLIDSILHEHILNKNFYASVFAVFDKEFGINLFETEEYNEDIHSWKTQLISRLSHYLDRIYSDQEIAQMSLDANSSLYHRMVTTEYTDIIAGESRVFSTNLRNKFAENGITKKTFWNTLINFFSR